MVIFKSYEMSVKGKQSDSFIGKYQQTSSCEVAEGFSDVAYQTSPDGNFRIKLKTNSSEFEIDEVASLEVRFEGSFISFGKKHHPKFLFPLQ